MRWQRFYQKCNRPGFITYHTLRITLLGLGVWLLLRPHSILAHNELRQTRPVAGETLNQSPAEIRLTFSEPPANGYVTLYNAQFQQIAGVTLLPPGENSYELAATVPQLEDGPYTVQWLTLSADNHTVSGSFQFAVRRTPPTTVMNNIIGGVLAAAILAGLILFWQGINNGEFIAKTLRAPMETRIPDKPFVPFAALR